MKKLFSFKRWMYQRELKRQKISFKRWMYQRELKKQKKKKSNQTELDEEFRKRMKEAYEQGVKQQANIGKVW